MKWFRFKTNIRDKCIDTRINNSLCEWIHLLNNRKEFCVSRKCSSDKEFRHLFSLDSNDLQNCFGEVNPDRIQNMWPSQTHQRCIFLGHTPILFFLLSKSKGEEVPGQRVENYPIACVRYTILDKYTDLIYSMHESTKFKMNQIIAHSVEFTLHFFMILFCSKCFLSTHRFQPPLPLSRGVEQVKLSLFFLYPFFFKLDLP